MFDSDFTELESEKLIEYAKLVDGNNTVRQEYLEIGTFRGGSLIKILQNTKLHCICIDLFEDFKLHASEPNTHITGTIDVMDLQKEINKLEYTNRVKLIKGHSEKVLDCILSQEGMRSLNGIILIDGNHKFKASFYDFLLSYILMDTGYLLLHNASNNMYPDKDYAKDDGGPYKVVEFAKGYPGIEYLGTFDRLAIFKKERI